MLCNWKLTYIKLGYSLPTIAKLISISQFLPRWCNLNLAGPNAILVSRVEIFQAFQQASTNSHIVIKKKNPRYLRRYSSYEVGREFTLIRDAISCTTVGH
jgi:hypothetical protein